MRQEKKMEGEKRRQLFRELMCLFLLFNCARLFNAMPIETGRKKKKTTQTQGRRRRRRKEMSSNYDKNKIDMWPCEDKVQKRKHKKTLK